MKPKFKSASFGLLQIILEDYGFAAMSLIPAPILRHCNALFGDGDSATKATESSLVFDSGFSFTHAVSDAFSPQRIVPLKV